MLRPLCGGATLRAPCLIDLQQLGRAQGARCRPLTSLNREPLGPLGDEPRPEPTSLHLVPTRRGRHAVATARVRASVARAARQGGAVLGLGAAPAHTRAVRVRGAGRSRAARGARRARDVRVRRRTAGRGVPTVRLRSSAGLCGLPGAAVPAAAAPPRPSSGLLNELRLQAGKSTLGSLNPLIDANAASFNDVTTGSSSGSCGFPRRLARDQGLRRRVGRRCAQLREARHGGDGAALDAEGEGPGGRAAAASWRSDRVCLARNGGGGALCRLSKRWGLLAALPRAVLAPHWGLENQTRGALG